MAIKGTQDVRVTRRTAGQQRRAEAYGTNPATRKKMGSTVSSGMRKTRVGSARTVPKARPAGKSQLAVRKRARY